ncbi:MAG: hypothetical protein QXG44_08070 [Candidatus Jordarchaeaceae archaeon]
MSESYTERFFTPLLKHIDSLEDPVQFKCEPFSLPLRLHIYASTASISCLCLVLA